jgi:hypothetical protein
MIGDRSNSRSRAAWPIGRDGAAGAERKRSRQWQ